MDGGKKVDLLIVSRLDQIGLTGWCYCQQEEEDHWWLPEVSTLEFDAVLTTDRTVDRPNPDRWPQNDWFSRQQHLYSTWHLLIHFYICRSLNRISTWRWIYSLYLFGEFALFYHLFLERPLIVIAMRRWSRGGADSIVKWSQTWDEINWMFSWAAFLNSGPHYSPLLRH